MRSQYANLSERRGAIRLPHIVTRKNVQLSPLYRYRVLVTSVEYGTYGLDVRRLRRFLPIAVQHANVRFAADSGRLHLDEGCRLSTQTV